MKDDKKYVEGYLIAMPEKKLPAYRRMAKKAGTVWKELGVLEFIECAGDDLDIKMGLPFPKLMKLKPGETAVFSWIVYKSKSQRNSVNAKVMKDPRLAKMMNPKDMPFEMKRMSYGGFKVIVNA